MHVKLISRSRRSLVLQTQPRLAVDCTVLFNPHNLERLRKLDGRHPDVQAAVKSSPGFSGIVAQVLEACNVDRKYATAEKPTVIVFQCLAGRHRSVACAELTGQMLRTAGFTVAVEHKELN